MLDIRLKTNVSSASESSIIAHPFIIAGTSEGPKGNAKMNTTEEFRTEESVLRESEARSEQREIRIFLQVRTYVRNLVVMHKKMHKHGSETYLVQ